MEQVKVGIVGCGMITARRHAPEYTDNPHAQIVGFYDFDQERAGELAAGYGGKVYGSPEELFADPEIDAVSICSPNYTHASYSIKALEAGKHVLCEKPMALTLEDTRTMMDTAQRMGKILMIGHNQRLLPTHRKARELLASGMIGGSCSAPRGCCQSARELLASGMIGNILSVQSNFRHSGPENWSVNRTNTTWFFDKNKAHFGALGDLGAHKLDIIRFLTGDEVQSICCDTVTRDKRYPNGELIDLEDNAFALFRMRSGIVGTMNVSWTNYGEEDNSTILYGDKGVMKIFGDFADDIVVELRDDTRVKYQVGAISTNQKQLKSGIIDDFVESIRTGRAPTVTGVDGHNTLAVIVAANQSAKERRWVDVAY